VFRLTLPYLVASNLAVKQFRHYPLALPLLFLLWTPSFLLAQGNCQKTAPPSQQSMGSRKDWVGLPNFGEVSPNLFRGGQPGVDGFESLKKIGVSIVVDMRSGPNDNEKRAVNKLGMQYVSIPWHCPFPSDEPFAKFLKVIEGNPDKKVFVHCRLGDDRTGMAVAAYRMAEQGWTADQALDEMEKFGFDWRHHMICPTLQSYEKSFPRRLKNNEAFRDLNVARGQK
jgi:tyrosine-protein phosphatase SIW14